MVEGDGSKSSASSLTVPALARSCSMWLSLGVSVFFFQAEDGIRDLTVTGVQTCALPIFEAALEVRAGIHAGRRMALVIDLVAGLPIILAAEEVVEADLVQAGRARVCRQVRSEERRVGKEGRSRWSPYH